MSKFLSGAAIIGMLTAPAALQAGETVTYTFDARGRLVKVERAGTVNDGAKVEYTLDKADNRKKVRSTQALPVPN